MSAEFIPARPCKNAAAGVGPVACRACDLNQLCRLSGLIAFDGGRRRQPTGAFRTVAAGESLFRAGQPARGLYAVRQGMLKTVHVDAEGDEQILGIHIPGDVLGFEAFSTGTYVSDAIALQPLVCCELPLHVLGENGTRVGELGSALVTLLSGASLPRLPAARGSIRQRLTNFMLDLSARLEQRGFDGRQFSLGLSRQDLADLLDARIETVSRMMQRLDREQAIRVRGNRVSLLALSARASN